MTPLLLASASPSRRAMLTAAGVEVETWMSGVDECALKEKFGGYPPFRLATTLAEAKAVATSEHHPNRLVLGGDSLATTQRRLFDKPASRTEAAEHLRAFSGRTLTITSAAVLARAGQAIWRHAEDAQLTVRALSETFIDRYLHLEWPAIAGCVGCFRIEGPGVQLFERTEGSHFTILGLPLLAVLAELRRLGEMPS